METCNIFTNAGTKFLNIISITFRFPNLNSRRKYLEVLHVYELAARQEAVCALVAESYRHWYYATM